MEDPRPLYKCIVCGAIVEEKIHCSRPCKKILDGKDRIKISKLLSGILRHFPEKFNIELDSEGWVDIDVLVTSIRQKRRDLKHINKEMIVAIALYDPKGRFEISGSQIRARYGHSTKVEISYPEDTKSSVLYHGTTRRNLPQILKEGLRPMRRLWVHLSVTVKDAIDVGKRHGKDVVVLKIDCNCLRRRGIKIYIASKSIRLVKHVPPECISLEMLSP